MPVHVGELTADVSVDPGAASTPDAAQSSAQSPWQQADAYRALRERLARMAERPRAEAYDD
jgi:hypothetical protein